MRAGNNPSGGKHARTLCAAALIIACCAGTSLADTPTELFRRGNDLMRQGKASEAVKVYTEAQSGGSSSAVDPAIPQHFADALLYNLGSAQLAAGNLAEAERSLRAVIERSLDASLRAKAGFNLGSLEATRAEPLAEEKPQEAVDTYRKAERFFRAALTDDPTDTATRENIDAVQRRIAALQEKIRQQEEEKQKQQQEQQGQSEQPPPPEKGGQGKDNQNNKSQQNQGENKEGGQQQDQQQKQQSASDALNRLSQEQKEQSRKSEEQAKQQPSDEKSKQQAESAQKQEDLRKQTEQAAEQLKQQAEKTQDPKQKEQLQDAAKKAQDATEQQKQAERDLKQGESEKAAEQQKQAAEKLSEAQASAERADEMRAEQEKQQQDKADAQKDDQQKGQQQQQAAQEAQQGKDGQQRPFDATAAQILDKEKENKRLLERYYRQLRGKPAPVKKDW